MGRNSICLMLVILTLPLLQASTAQGFSPNTDPDLAGLWKLDETSGATAADSSGHGYNGTLNGGPQWIAGKIGGALQLDGANDVVRIPAMNLNTSAGATLSAWIRPNNTQTDWCGVIFARTGGQAGIWITNSRELRYTWGSVAAAWGWNSGFVAPANEWSFVAIVIEPSKGTMYLNNQSNSNVTTHTPQGFSGETFLGWDPQNANKYYGGALDDCRIYTRPLSATEIKLVMQGGEEPELASKPNPADKATDIVRDVIVGWTPGKYAAKHDVYLGTNPADVDAANRTTSKGVLVSQDQDANTYDPVGLLELGKTYYWRIDEVNAPPTSTVFKGYVWNFTVEPLVYQIRNVTATASSSYNANMSPGKTVDGSGLNANDQHGTTDTTMWLSGATGPQPTWIQYEFDKVYKLHEMWVWNSNQSVEPFIGFGLKNVTIQYSTDDANWTQLAGVPDFVQGTGLADYTHNTTVSFGGAAAKYVKITANSNWGVLKQYGLSEVRFFQIPVQAREPNPTTGQTDVPLNATLHWRAGREAATHKLYISTGKKTVRDGTITPISVPAGNSYVSYGPMSLELGKTYFWKVDEVNEAKTPSTWQGDIWSFTTHGYITVDDFEDYNNSSPKRIFQTWIDGFGYSEPAPGSPGNGSGSTVGNINPPFAETRAGYFHAGRQAMPMDYNDARAPYYSEAERTFTTAQDWTAQVVKSLTIWFRGIPGSTGSLSYDQAADTYTMRGSGADIWGTADQFHYAYKQVTGNCMVIARIDSVQNTNAWAKAGVMIRETLDANSPFVDMVVSADNRVAFQWRTAKGVDCGNPDSSTHTVTNSFTLPHWIKLTRTGNTFTAQHSADGVNWVDITPETAGDPLSMTILMNSTAYIGLAVTSHNAAATCEAKISKASIAGTFTPAGAFTTSKDIGIASNAREPLYVAVTDSAGKAKAVTNTDPNAVLQSTWQEWNVPLKAFSDAGVNLKAVKKLSLGTGNKAAPVPGGTGSLYFDDIRLYPLRCLPSLLKPAADVNSDCVVDHRDIDTMADQWLKSAPPALSTDLNADSKVDLKDFVKMAQGWLEQQLWP